MAGNYKKNNVLVAIMPTVRDWYIAQTQKWYRIPVNSAPEIVKKGKVEILAFYYTRNFKREKYSIRYYAYVKNISCVKRKELLPDDFENFEKFENDYYKIEFDNLILLDKPILSLRGRRIIFIPTTKEKFFNASEINHLFNASKLEDILWGKLIDNNIISERQLFCHLNDKIFCLDFAIFCQLRNINIECDGDAFHVSKEAVQKDKQRNNILESKGWSVLRFTTSDLTFSENLNNSINIIKETINNLGGVKEQINISRYRHYF
jgi:very-short-patch-repair endonuclease